MKRQTKIKIIMIIALLLIAAGCFMIYRELENKTIEYLVSFIDEDGNKLYEKNVEAGTKVEKIEPEEREGYVFIGWYDKEKLYDFMKPINQDITLVGKWEEKYEKRKTYMVSFYSDGKIYQSQEIVENETAYIPEEPQKEGYRFVGWYLDGASYKFDTPVTQDIKLEAKFEQNQILSEELTTTPGETIPESPNSDTPIPTAPNVPQEPPKEIEFIKENGIQANYDNIILRVEESTQLVVTITPANASVKDLHIYCEDEFVCSVDGNKKLVANHKGNTNLIIQTFHGLTKTIPVTVKSNYYGKIRDNKLFIFNSEEDRTAGEVTFKYIATNSTKTVLVTTEGYPIEGEIEVLSIDVKD